MKKLFTLILTLCLLGGANALAEDTQVSVDGESGSTTVSYTVERNAEFIVTIPAAATLTGTAEAADVTGDLTIALDGTKVNVNGFKVTVTLDKSANSFKLVNGDTQVAYTVSKDGSAITAGAEVLVWTYDPTETAKTASQTLSLSATAASFVVAGEYTDTLTFKVGTNATAVTVKPNPGWDGGFDVDF